jgi:MoxR-like ATPase
VIDDDALRRLVRTRTDAVPATREHCPTPEALQDAAMTPRDSDAHRAVLEHVATCAPCRRDFDLLRTANLAAPAVVRAAMPRWVPALAAAAVIAVVSLVATRSNDDVVRGAPDRAAMVQLLTPVRIASGIQLQWRAVPQAVSYRVEVTDDEGNLAFSTETADTTALATTRANASLRWSVEARLLDGTVLTSALDTLPGLP